MDDQPALTLVGTPLGNLEDISVRAQRALATADTILAEDTRVTAKLLTLLDIDLPQIERLDEHATPERIQRIVERAQGGERFVLCTDAGMPAVSDPGAQVVSAFYEAELLVGVIPGPTAVSAAVALAGFPASAIYFAGFAPRKHGARIELFERLASLPATLVFYESPHRVKDTLKALCDVFPTRSAALVRELTKLHEEVVRAPLPELVEEIASRDKVRGECVIVVEPPQAAEKTGAYAPGSIGSDGAQMRIDLGTHIDEQLNSGVRKSDLAKEVMKLGGLTRDQAYELVVLRGKALQDSEFGAKLE